MDAGCWRLVCSISVVCRDTPWTIPRTTRHHHHCCQPWRLPHSARWPPQKGHPWGWMSPACRPASAQVASMVVAQVMVSILEQAGQLRVFQCLVLRTAPVKPPTLPRKVGPPGLWVLLPTQPTLTPVWQDTMSPHPCQPPHHRAHPIPPPITGPWPERDQP